MLGKILYHVGTTARAAGDATKSCIMFIVLSAAYLSSLLGVYYVICCGYCMVLDCTLSAQCDVYNYVSCSEFALLPAKLESIMLKNSSLCFLAFP